MQRNKIFIALGIILLLAAGVWRFAIGSSAEQRLADDWSWEGSYLGALRYVDAGEADFAPELVFPDDDGVNTYNRDIIVVDSDADTVTIQDKYVTRNVDSGAVTWEFIFNAKLDRETGQILDDEFKGHYYVFPRNVEQKSYTMTHTSYRNVVFEFVEEAEVEGLNTYHFRYAGDLEYTFAYASSGDFVGFDVEENQEIRCPEIEVNYWVEPLTGEIVKAQEQCPEEAVYDTTNGEAIYKTSRWYGESTVSDIRSHVDDVKSERNSILMNTLYIPVGLLIAGLLLIAVSVVPMLMGSKQG